MVDEICLHDNLDCDLTRCPGNHFNMPQSSTMMASHPFLSNIFHGAMMNNRHGSEMNHGWNWGKGHWGHDSSEEGT